ncbi:MULTISPECIES: hypothetical protein [unclassified Chryseobacterium]|uniref:hypothetical protein n=1 Tax=unclassified Chryseobacterium TaxID=2593645 RepID=UPI00100C308E|nr:MULTISPECIES: hypothetical protein [unclassified Chryseobacterium]RXM53214.1 hypothetical protein BOQ64_02190 [Chryseobacterium sp. CH25]RXM65591.1 hypothetical protein BOQ60_07305 [Chryseobacterium sp. CH1]
MNKYLNVSEIWYNWFVKNSIEVVTTIDNREFFEHKIEGKFQGNQINYDLIFQIFQIFQETFTFLEIEKIRLEYSEGIDLDNLQFYSVENIYDEWKENILSKFSKTIKSDDFYEDSTTIFYNYFINVDGVEKRLYQLSQNDQADIFLFYDQNKNIIRYKINITLRKILFMCDNDFEFNMLQNILDYNNNLLDLASNGFKKKLQKIESIR